MEYEIVNPQILAGMSLDYAKAGDNVRVKSSDFLTPQSGREYYKLLSVVSNYYLQEYLAKFPPHSIRNFLILLNKSGKIAKVYINKNITATTICKRAIKANQILRKSDISGICTLQVENINYNNFEGVIFYITQEWKSGIYYNFEPMYDSRCQLCNLEYTFAQIYQTLLFDEYSQINQINETQFYGTGWFPFVAIQGEMSQNLIEEFLNTGSVQNSEIAIINKFSNVDTLNELLKNYDKNEFIKPHIQFIKQGVDRFLHGDWISCISIVWPRIEGIIRYLYNIPKRFTQESGLEYLKELLEQTELVPQIYFPEAFKTYMLNFYFKNFDLEKEKLELSRNTIGHGVSKAETYDKKSCIIAFLIINQLYYYSSFLNSVKKFKEN